MDKTIDAQLLSKMFLAGAKNLDAKKEWINELNVFPVPDGDTGTNMTMTILSAAREVSAIETMTMESFAKAISSGSLRGARGNSGVILSQLLRGFANVVGKCEIIDKPVLSQAFEKACETAYKAVIKPKEGTILTVAKGAANMAQDLAYDDAYDMDAFIHAIVEEADHVLSLTPEMLPVLKQAGVVDSGGQGLVQVLKGACAAFEGKEIDTTIEPAQHSSGIIKISKETEAEIKFGYCTEFIVVLNKKLSDQEQMDFRDYLESIGDSIVMVADDEICKVHVHTNEPGNALQRGLTMGSLSHIKIDNMREEHQERLFKNAEKLAAEQKAEEEKKKQSLQAEKKEVGFIAVSSGEGLEKIFLDMGADKLITGGQTMNPSTEDFLNAIGEVNADSIFLLPNNKNIILAANQAAELTEDKKVYVVPTKTIPQGITALISFVPGQPAEENLETMKEMIAGVQTGEVTYSIRDTVIEGRKIAKGDFMGIGDAGILANGPDLETVTMEMTKAMVNEESSMISIYYGEDAKKEEAEKLENNIAEAFPECECELNFGGEPVYYYIISIE